jgi:hypothetical protein
MRTRVACRSTVLLSAAFAAVTLGLGPGAARLLAALHHPSRTWTLQSGSAQYAAWGETGTITRQLTLVNRGQHVLHVESFPSLSWQLPSGDYQLTTLRGGWGQSVHDGVRYQLNFGKAEVRQWATAEMDRIVREHGLDWVKVDYNANIGERFNADDGTRPGDVHYRHVRGYYAWLDELRQSDPWRAAVLELEPQTAKPTSASPSQ